MGQYYILVNPVKKQYLNPHKFGAGLKLMEFTNTTYGPQQALCILISNGNGQGGGDLNTDGLTDDEKALIGSWAGDPVIVAGDYGEPWKFFARAEYDGKTYTEKEELYRHSSGMVATHEDLPSGSSSPTGKHKNVTRTFGMRKNRDTKELEPHDENLYSVARTFFEDISDKVITVVAKGEGGYHPWAAIDLKSERGWREVPEWGVLPETAPTKPAGGKKAYNTYAKNAKPQGLSLVDDIAGFIERHPEQGELLLSLVASRGADAIKAAKAREAERKARGW